MIAFIRVPPWGWYRTSGFTGFPCIIVPGKSVAFFIKKGEKSQTRPSKILEALEATSYEDVSSKMETKQALILEIKSRFPKTPILRAKGVIY